MPAIETLVFDLDHTLYSLTSEVEKRVNKRVDLFFTQKLGASPREAKKIRQDLLQRYRYEAEGIAQQYHQSPKEFMDFICDIDVSFLPPNPQLDKLLAGLPQNKYILTDSTKKHVNDTLAALKVKTEHFSGIFDAGDGNYVFKPNRSVFETFFSQYELIPAACIMFEDNVLNLQTAKSLGMATVLISNETNIPSYVDYVFPDINSGLSTLQKIL